MQHTKGPWIAKTWRDGKISVVTPVSEKKFIGICEVDGCNSREETEANAKLIAAAPDLYNAAYSALQALYAMPKKKQGFYQYLINDLLKAIQEAKGVLLEHAEN